MPIGGYKNREGELNFKPGYCVIALYRELYIDCDVISSLKTCKAHACVLRAIVLQILRNIERICTIRINRAKCGSNPSPMPCMAHLRHILYILCITTSLGPRRSICTT